MIDIQSSGSHSKFKIDSVGVTAVKYPIMVSGGDDQPSRVYNANWELGVPLPESERGTHMSRFLETLVSLNDQVFGLDEFYSLAETVSDRLEAQSSTMSARFDWMRLVKAPISKREAFMDYDVTFKANTAGEGTKTLCITATATALCPCSKAISEYGAHNQRSYVTAELSFGPETKTPCINKIIAQLEDSASSPVYPLLKREDEKHVTEYAYDNPRFVEDLARSVAEKLYDLPNVKEFKVKVINQESIHNHDCYAVVKYTRD